MMLTGVSVAILVLGLLAIVLPNLRVGAAKRMLGDGAHRAICLAVFALGCAVRLIALCSLPDGAFAEEALVGVQAKALWQTGGFLFFDGGLTAQLAQWPGESTGPLLAVLTAPFVGLLGMNTLAVRLPLTLLSCAAMPAAYGLGRALGGKRMGRWCLTAYAICPYFVLMARMTCGANAAVYLLPIALWAMVRGLERPAPLYAGAALMGLTAYTQDMYFFIAPAAVVLCGVIAAVHGGIPKRHALLATALGLLVCVPAMLTLYVNLTGAQPFTWLGVVHIPRLEDFDKADSLLDTLAVSTAGRQDVLNKVYAVLIGALFQVVSHMNISAELFAPTGMCALYVLSVPLMLLGGFSLLHGVLSGRRVTAGGALAVSLAAVTMVMLVLYGSAGMLDTTGVTSVFDYSAFFLFDVLLMAAGLRQLEEKSRAGIASMTALLAVCFALLCGHLFGEGYLNGMNVYFSGFGELAKKAADAQAQTGAKVNVTGTVYPHIRPSEAAEMMYLYAADADMREVSAQRGTAYEVIYAPGIESPNPDEIYLVAQSDATAWDLSAFAYEEMGQYALLTPRTP